MIANWYADRKNDILFTFSFENPGHIAELLKMWFTEGIFRSLAVLVILVWGHVEGRVLSSERETFESMVDVGRSLCSLEAKSVYSFTIPYYTESAPNDPIDLLYVQFDGSRKMPFATTALHNNLNHDQGFSRVDNFRKYPCSAIQEKQTTCSNTFKMTEAQKALTGRTAFDRGHLTPSNPMRFAASANDATFFCVNIAPQDPYTNQGPWATIEAKTHEMLKTTPGLVMTGVCDEDSPDGLTVDGWRVPACFWKLICYRDSGRVTRVVGFIGDNTLFHKDDAAAKAVRTAETTRPRSQLEILAKFKQEKEKKILVDEAWREAERWLVEIRHEKNAPFPNDCIAAKTAPTGTLVEWGLK